MIQVTIIQINHITSLPGKGIAEIIAWTYSLSIDFINSIESPHIILSIII